MTANLLQLNIADGVARITFNNPPVNVMSGSLMRALKHLLHELSGNKEVQVIVFDSANPDFFIAHVDINILDEQEILDELQQSAPEGLNLFQAIGEMIRAQPQVTIVKLKGIARGGGAEFVAAADLSFAALESGKLSQCEALMGIIPGGGATQYLSEKMTRGRVLEVILGADLFDAATAADYGWINRAIPGAAVDTFVDRLAAHIAALPAGVIAAAKKVLSPVRNIEGFKSENEGWQSLVFQPRTAEIMTKAMQNGAQTVAGELKIEELLRSI
ncbi:enoyl-CoA hydratase/isomerase family protein [Chitinophaga sp.]|uniref:enoyl-CoA hydratase/isomerase family protein n=1 Tax=Chitinophaga sp. TaxID=1869181 RepID=UPI0031DAB153